MDMAEEHANLNIIGTQLFVEHPVEGVVEVEISEVDSSDPDFTIFGLTDAVGSTEFKTHRELTALLAQERQEKLEQCHAMLQALDTAVRDRDPDAIRAALNFVDTEQLLQAAGSGSADKINAARETLRELEQAGIQRKLRRASIELEQALAMARDAQVFAARVGGETNEARSSGQQGSNSFCFNSSIEQALASLNDLHEQVGSLSAAPAVAQQTPLVTAPPQQQAPPLPDAKTIATPCPTLVSEAVPEPKLDLQPEQEPEPEPEPRPPLQPPPPLPGACGADVEAARVASAWRGRLRAGRLVRIRRQGDVANVSTAGPVPIGDDGASLETRPGKVLEMAAIEKTCRVELFPVSVATTPPGEADLGTGADERAPQVINVHVAWLEVDREAEAACTIARFLRHAAEKAAHDSTVAPLAPVDGGGAKSRRRSLFSKKKKGDEIRASVMEGQVVMQGVLKKLTSGRYARWQQRYFVLQGHYLKYFASEQVYAKGQFVAASGSGDDVGGGADTSTVKAGNIKGTINLAEVDSITSAGEEIEDGIMADPCVIILKTSDGGALTQLRASEEYEAERWLAALRGLAVPPAANTDAEVSVAASGGGGVGAASEGGGADERKDEEEGGDSGGDVSAADPGSAESATAEINDAKQAGEEGQGADPESSGSDSHKNNKKKKDKKKDKDEKKKKTKKAKKK